MSKKGSVKTAANHKANQANANKGSKGTNAVYKAVQHNRAKQMDPNQKA